MRYASLQMTTEHDDGSGKPRVSLCCHVNTFLTGDNCVKEATNGTEVVQLPAIYETNLELTNITTSDEYFNFVVWNPCAGRNRYPLNPYVYMDEKWYLMSNGSILRPLAEELEERILDYHQYCLARVKGYEYQEYLVFFCEETYAIEDDDSGGIVYSFGMLVSVPFLAATYIIYWLLPDLKNLHGLTLRGYVGCLAMAYSIVGMLQLTPQEQILTDICITLELRQNSTSDTFYTNSTRNHGDKVELLQHNLSENFIKDNDNVQYKSDTNSTNYHENDNSTQYEFRPHSIKDHKKSNQMLMELDVNSTKIEDKNSFMSYELRGNLTQIENKGNLTLYEFHKKTNKNDKKNNIFSYEICDNIICIPLCCPLGDRLIEEKCIAGKGNYPFPDVYSYITSDSLQKEGKKLDELFQLVVYDPCQQTGRFLLNPDDPEHPNDEYMFLTNGSLYQPHYVDFIPSTSYCLAVVHRDKFDVTVCFGTMNETSDNEISDVNHPLGTPVGLIVSLPFLLATFVVYSILPELMSMHGYTLRGYVGSLFVAYTVLVMLQLTQPNAIAYSVCIILAFVIHFSFLASFFWLNVMCFDIWWTFGGFRSLQGSVKQREKKKFIMYSIYAWGSASILTIICAIMDFVPSVPKNFIRPEFGVVRCWYNTDAARALYFYGPMGITVFCNICLFISTALKIVRHKKDTALHLRSSESRRHDDNKQWFNLYLKLFIVMGINWSMEIVSWLFDKSAPTYIWYLTDLTNTLQGLIIFIIFVWKEKIKRLLLKRFGCQDRGIFSRNSTRSGCHSLSASRTCTTTSGMIPLQEKISSYAQANCAKNSSDEADP
ncbi:G-protein coupled receptor Mth2 isoform X2 [Polyergus mexicanus]|uniref:G-protein coupled receptor Mth2 isoform X2 n=1 Tax=Polyergus mexicanus TaxID=615972 RepID=UPI0038B62CAD